MSADARQSEIQLYAAAVRESLADLPAAEQAVLLEDLDDHLNEVSAESDSSLEERLGPAVKYAQELRAAFRATGPAANGPVVWALRPVLRMAGWIADTAWYRAVRKFLPELRPAWWVLRAYLLVLGIAELDAGGRSVGPLPNLATKLGLFQAAATVVAIVVSVRIGRSGLGISSAWRLPTAAANGVLGIVSLLALAQLGTAVPFEGVDQGSYPLGLQVFAQGEVTNLYPYSTDGTPLHGVLLYDQNGEPVTLPGSKGAGVFTDLPQDAEGRPITNEYPLHQSYPDGQPVQAPSVAVPQQPATLSPSPTPTPRPSTSP